VNILESLPDGYLIYTISPRYLRDISGMSDVLFHLYVLYCSLKCSFSVVDE